MSEKKSTQFENLVLDTVCSRIVGVDKDLMLNGSKKKESVLARALCAAVLYNHGIIVARIARLLNIHYKSASHLCLSHDNRMGDVQYSQLYRVLYSSVTTEMQNPIDIASRLERAEAAIARTEQRINHLQELMLNK